MVFIFYLFLCFKTETISSRYILFVSCLTVLKSELLIAVVVFFLHRIRNKRFGILKNDDYIKIISGVLSFYWFRFEDFGKQKSVPDGHGKRQGDRALHMVEILNRTFNFSFSFLMKIIYKQCQFVIKTQHQTTNKTSQNQYLQSATQKNEENYELNFERGSLYWLEIWG